MAINLRSPYYTSTSEDTTAYTTLDISIWNGDKNTPVTAQYSLRKNVIGTSVDVLFEISELVRDYVDVTFDGDYSGQAVWVKTVKTAYDSSNAPLQVFTNTQSAFDGYSYFEEPNLSPNNNSVFISNRELFVLEDNTFRIPIHTANSPEVVFYKDGEVIASETFNTEDLSSNQIKYVSIYGDDTNYDTFQERVIEGGGSYELNNCLQSFLNSYSIGAVDKITVSGNSYGNELVSNGNFETDTSWTKETSDWTINNGAGILNSTDLAIDRLYQVASVNGLNLYSEFTVTNFSGTGTASMRYPFPINITGNGTYRVEGVGEFDRIQFQGQADDLANPLTFSISNVSVKESYGAKIETIKVNVIEECKYDPKKITFINKFGALQDMYFFKKSKESLRVKKESYKSNIISSLGAYNSSNHVNRNFNVVGSESISLSSGYLSEEYNEVFKQLMLSEKVWVTNILETGEQVLPINVKTSSIAYKTSVNDKLVDYTIEFDKSFDTINNIR